MKTPSKLEKISGDLAVQLLATGVAASTASAVIPPSIIFLPVLTSFLATNRHSKRIEETLKSFQEELGKLKTSNQDLTDNQYKLVNEIVLTALQTTEEEKIAFLKQAFKTGIQVNYELGYATQLSRVLRDISAAELQFLISNFGVKTIAFDVGSGSDNEIVIKNGTPEDVVVSGLMSLSLIIPFSSTFDGAGQYRFSPLVAKLIVLLKP